MAELMAGFGRYGVQLTPLDEFVRATPRGAQA
jgi:hypothetical protein